MTRFHKIWMFWSILVTVLFHLDSAQQSCPPPDVPMDGQYLPKQATFLLGDRLVYTCNEGFTLMGKDVRACQSDGAWSGRTPFCERPSKLKNPRVSNSFSTAIYKVIDKSTDTCYTWEKSVGNSLSVYLDDSYVVYAIRLYLDKGTTKIDITTGVDNTFKLCSTYDRTLERGQWVLVNCNGDDILADTVKITSTSDRASIITICEIQVYVKDRYGCEHPPEVRIANGYFQVSRSKATLVCEEGYNSENSRLVCEGNFWKGLGPRCTEILCGPDVNNSTFPPGAEWKFLDSTSKISAGTRRQLQCPTGYKNVGEPQIVRCWKNGTWTKTNATCIVNPKATTRTIVLGAVGAITIFIILFLLGVTIYLIKKQRKREVVVVYKSPTDGSIYSEPDGLYETIHHGKPQPPTSPRPPELPPVLGQKFLPAPDTKETAKKQPLPTDIAFGTLKQSALYGN